MKIFNLSSVYKSTNRLSALKGLVCTNSDLYKIGFAYTALDEYYDVFVQWLIENGYQVRKSSFDEMLIVINPKVEPPKYDVYTHKTMYVTSK